MSATTVLLAALLSTASAAAPPRAAQGVATAATTGEPVPSPFELLHAQPFVLEEPYVHTWCKEQPEVRSGYVFVLRADRELVTPRQTLEPVLFVGAQTAERVNAPLRDPGPAGAPGPATAQLVVLVPAPLDPNGRVALDPWREPTFLGTPMLPEDVDASIARRELARALRLHLPPARRPAANGPALARTPVQPPLQLVDRTELNLVLADLIERYSPEETDLIHELRLLPGRH